MENIAALEAPRKALWCDREYYAMTHCTIWDMRYNQQNFQTLLELSGVNI